MHFSALKVTEVSPVHPEKADSPMEVTELGMVTEVSPEQPRKADEPMEVTELGMVTEESPEQSRKAELGIVVTLLPIFNVVRFIQSLNTG